MNLLPPLEWSKAERVLFRLCFTYLTLYFLFISNYFVFFFPFLTYIHSGLHFISSVFISFVNNIFLHKDFDGSITLDDNYWLFVTTLSYFVLAVLVTIAWTLFSQQKHHLRLFRILHTYCRYYLAFVLFVYGSAKLLGNQFGEPSPDVLIKPLGDFDAHTLLWIFMGASRSYNSFGGLLEVVAGMFLLFRRTSTFGTLVAIGTLVNVLMLDLGYDTLVKMFVFHLILIGIFIISADIQSIFGFFFERRAFTLSRPVVAIGKNLPERIRLLCKLGLISYVAFIIFGGQFKKSQSVSPIKLSGLDGVYEIKAFQRPNGNYPTNNENTATAWKRIAIDNAGDFTVQFINDSFSVYRVKIDTSFRSLTLSSFNDTSFKSTLYYTHDLPDHYQFAGIFYGDSILISSTKVDLSKKPLMKNKGKVQWTWE